MAGAKKAYPIGIQTFSEIREKGYLYVDKTSYVFQMTRPELKYAFLGRPRRFGKSLLISTLQAYFEGRKDLFKGLAIDKLEKEWTSYPVLHFDMSTAKYRDCESLILELENKFPEYERIYGREETEIKPNQRLEGLIKRACRQTGKQVVVLIDEYDAPLLDVAHETENLPELRDVIRNFYSPLKTCDPYLRYVFLTGITKFSQLSIFSELNNITNISLREEYAAICGITEEEMETQISTGLDNLAERLHVSRKKVIETLKENYDGYHFSWPSPDIYNPFSLLNALSEGKMNAYWFGSGTPTYLIQMLRRYHIVPQQIGGRKCVAADFDAPTERLTSITPLLYQSGYITIKQYNPISQLYTLDIPNNEVRIGLMRSLLPNYVQCPDQINTLVGEMAEQLYHDDMDGALHLMQTVLSTIPYCENTHYEGHYQQMLYLLFSLLGYYVDVEVCTPRGRVDMVLRTETKLYVIELKIDGSADKALQQIDLRDYPERFAFCQLPIVKVGINFDSKRHTLEEWRIQPSTATS